MKHLTSVIGLLFALCATAQEYSVELSRRNSLYLVDTKIGGHTEKFTFDTGASCTMINSDLCTLLKSEGHLTEPQLSTVLVTMADESEIECRVVYIDELEIGSAKFQDVKALCVPGSDAEPLVGHTIIERMSRHSFQGNRLTFELLPAERQKYLMDCNWASDLLNYGSGSEAELQEVYDMLTPYFNNQTIVSEDLDIYCRAVYNLDRFDEFVVAFERLAEDKSYDTPTDMYDCLTVAYAVIGKLSEAKMYLDKYVQSEDTDQEIVGYLHFMLAEKMLYAGQYDEVLHYVGLLKEMNYKPEKDE